MNPQACFSDILNHIIDYNRIGGQEGNLPLLQAFSLMDDLWRWLKNDGIAPKIPQGTFISVGASQAIAGGIVAYSLLSKPGNLGATLIRYEWNGLANQFKATGSKDLPFKEDGPDFPSIVAEVAERTGGTVRDNYSGCGMGGDTCYGIVCNDSRIHYRIVECASSLGLFGAQSDRLGDGYIVYWPNIKGTA